MRPGVWSLIHLAIVCYNVAREGTHRRFVGELEALLERKRSIECAYILSGLRPGACLVVERGCCYRIFDRWLGRRKKAFIYGTRHGRVRVADDYADKTADHFVLSPGIDFRRGYQCCFYDYRLSGSLNRALLNSFYMIFNCMYASPHKRFFYDGMQFERTATPHFEMLRLSVPDLGILHATHYHRDCRTMTLVRHIADVLRKKSKDRTSKSEWSTSAVDMLLEMLVAERVLKHSIPLADHPEIVPLLFPFQFLDTKYKCWSYVDLITVGVDLRSVRGDRLSRFFNMGAVDALCRAGGVYILTTEY